MKSESEVAQSCQTLSDPMDCSLPGSSVHEIFQARVLEWVAIAFSILAGYIHVNSSHNCAYLVIKQILLDVSSEFSLIAILSLYIYPFLSSWSFHHWQELGLPDFSLLTLLVPKYTTFMLSLLQEPCSQLKKILNQFCVLPGNQA